MNKNGNDQIPGLLTVLYWTKNPRNKRELYTEYSIIIRPM